MFRVKQSTLLELPAPESKGIVPPKSAITFYHLTFLVINQLNAQNLVFISLLYAICLYMFRALCAHHQEVKIVLYSIWYHHTL